MAAFGKKARAALLVAALLTLVMLVSIAAAQTPRRAPEQRLDQRLTVEELGKAHSSLRQTRDSDTIDIILALHEGANLSAGRPGRSKGLRYANLSGLELASLLTDTAVQWVWPDLQTQAWLDRSVYQIGADALWAFNLTGAGVKIAILDTGIAAEHEMLSGRVVATADFTGSYGYDGHGHGTHVAGIAAGDGQYTGVAPGAQIYSGKVLNDQGYGQLSWLIEGLQWAIENNVDVISLSLGATYSGSPEEQLNSPEVRKIEEAVASGITVVVASGNCGNGCGSFTGVTTPGIARDAITIGAVDRESNWLPFSGGDTIDNYVKPDIVAPGKGICSSVPWGYACWSGTSMATPHVAGAAALLKQHDPSLSPGAVKAALEQSAMDLGDEGKDARYGSGAMSLSTVLGYLAEPVAPAASEYALAVPALTAGKHGEMTLAFTSQQKEECRRLLFFERCAPRRITVRMTASELDGVFVSTDTQTVPFNKTRSYALRFAPLVPGRHNLHVVISESDTMLYDFDTTFPVGAPETTITMNPVGLVVR